MHLHFRVFGAKPDRLPNQLQGLIELQRLVGLNCLVEQTLHPEIGDHLPCRQGQQGQRKERQPPRPRQTSAPLGLTSRRSTHTFPVLIASREQGNQDQTQRWPILNREIVAVRQVVQFLSIDLLR